MSAAHTPRANVRVHLTNPESGYESETETTVSPEQWAVIDAVLCGREQPYGAAPDLLEALYEVLPAVRAYLMSGDDIAMALKGQTWSPALRRAEAAIAKATTAVEPNSVGTPQGVNQK